MGNGLKPRLSRNRKPLFMKTALDFAAKKDRNHIMKNRLIKR